jgi:hypothetical protein
VAAGRAAADTKGGAALSAYQLYGDVQTLRDPNATGHEKASAAVDAPASAVGVAGLFSTRAAAAKPLRDRGGPGGPGGDHYDEERDGVGRAEQALTTKPVPSAAATPSRPSCTTAGWAGRRTP